ncbi:MAG: DUF4382 domain-containing protein [Bacteroidales bacterium]
MKRGIVRNMIGLAALLSVLAGCQESAMEPGRLVVNLTDAPFPIEQIQKAGVTITKVEIRSKNTQDGNPYLTIFSDSAEFDMMELRNGIRAQLANLEVPAGTYDEIRLHVTNTELQLVDGTTYSVKVPSGFQSGLKIKLDPEVRLAPGGLSVILLDFNLEKSFILKGTLNQPDGITGFNFSPVIRAVDEIATGQLEGWVKNSDSLSLADANVWIEKDSVVANAFTEEDGYFALPGIPAGYYTLCATKTGYDTVRVEEFRLQEGIRLLQTFYLTLQ